VIPSGRLRPEGITPVGMPARLTGTVVVAANYRLGAPGFPHLAGLGPAAPTSASTTPEREPARFPGMR